MTRARRLTRRASRAASLAALVAVAFVGAGPATAGPAEDALVRQSGLPPADVADLLKDCDADQQSMYFCAWRDLIAQEQALDAAMATRASGHAGCLARLQQAARGFRRDRDRQCKASARADYQGGSMEPTADLLCRQASTHEEVGEVSHMPCP